MDSESAYSLLRRDGYCVFPGGISKNTLLEKRELIRDYLISSGIKYDGGFLQPDMFRNIRSSAEIVSFSKLQEVFGDHGAVVLCRHADAHLNKGTGWHKDRPEEYYFDEKVNYNLFKVGVYLQDHSSVNYRGKALTVKKGSHKSVVLHDPACESVAIDPKFGDVVVFDLRLSHKGAEFPRWQKVFNKLGFKSRLAKYRQGSMGRDDKLAVFYTFALVPHDESEESLIYMKEHMREVSERQVRQSGGGGASDIYDENVAHILDSGCKYFEDSGEVLHSWTR